MAIVPTKKNLPSPQTLPEVVQWIQFFNANGPPLDPGTASINPSIAWNPTYRYLYVPGAGGTSGPDLTGIDNNLPSGITLGNAGTFTFSTVTDLENIPDYFSNSVVWNVPPLFTSFTEVQKWARNMAAQQAYIMGFLGTLLNALKA